MSLGNNLQYLRSLRKNMTQESLAEQLHVSRQTVSKWEMNAALPEMDKAIALCEIFNCSLDSLFREEMDKRSDACSNLRVEEVEGFRYAAYTVISADPEPDAIGRVREQALQRGVRDPKVIGWDFPCVSAEQINVHHMHGYTAAWIVPQGTDTEGLQIKEQPKHRYAAVHIDRPFDQPFATIPGAYRTLDHFMRVNGLAQIRTGVIPCFETDGESMDIYIACE
ncbi:MAG: helix-turn-helix domain-containing protein [Clostridia bacterium]|nr:helix-turn-helix domain-containing protein [Clostridia bacterium]MBQ6961119.1 helix-turn-helix domain-containing protein [Clostridia bacterium]